MVGFIELDLTKLSVGGCVLVRDNNKTPYAGYYGGANLRIPSGITKIYNSGIIYTHSGDGDISLDNASGVTFMGGAESGRFCMMIYRTADTLYALCNGATE